MRFPLPVKYFYWIRALSDTVLFHYNTASFSKTIHKIHHLDCQQPMQWSQCVQYHTKIDLIHKPHNTPVPYPTMLYSEQKCAHFCFKWSIVGYGTGAFWHLWNWSTDMTWLQYAKYIGVSVQGYFKTQIWMCLNARKLSMKLNTHNDVPTSQFHTLDLITLLSCHNDIQNDSCQHVNSLSFKN